MLPLAPALLSITKVAPRRFCSSSATMRAIVSPVPLPPGAGTTSWIVLPGCGQSCATAGAATTQESSASAAAKGRRRDIVGPAGECVERDVGTMLADLPRPDPCRSLAAAVRRLPQALQLGGDGRRRRADERRTTADEDVAVDLVRCRAIEDDHVVVVAVVVLADADELVLVAGDLHLLDRLSRAVERHQPGLAGERAERLHVGALEV